MPLGYPIPYETIQRRAATRRARLDGLAASAYAEYLTGKSISQLAREHGRAVTSMRNLFEARGLALRPDHRSRLPHRADGTFACTPLLTDAEANALADAATDLRVPPALKLTWRKWPLARRAQHLARIRVRLKFAKLPPGPFSANVVPFDYSSAAAHEIVRRANAGSNSRTKNAQIKTNSGGVIFEGALWFFKSKTGYARDRDSAKCELLHHVIWSRAHGRPVPRSHVLRYIDGNPNHLVAANLQLLHRDELARENQARALSAKSRQLTTALLTRSQGQSSHATITDLRHSSFRS